jgi:RNA polymerase sigma-70 factor (ECF subfamily)
VTALAAQLGDAFVAHERYLWGMCYRMTGSAADADDLVQDTFARAIERPPPRTDKPLRPWLVRVAINLSRDLLRRRRRRGYTGPWLPSPVEPPSYELVADDGPTTAGRYDLLESVSFAFLLALEALTPQQRAVLLLRDVFDYSVRETMEALDMKESNVKTTLHRARRKLRDYDRDRRVPTNDLTAQTRQALERMLGAIATQDVATLEKLVAEDAKALSDGGGEYFAAGVPIVGRDKVIRFYLKLARSRGMPKRSEIRTINGLPALVTEFEIHGDRNAPLVVTSVGLDSSGKITAVHSILASSKLTNIRIH